MTNKSSVLEMWCKNSYGVNCNNVITDGKKYIKNSNPVTL